jgi:hypothetical protein
MEHALAKAGMVPFRQFSPFHVIHTRYIVACNMIDPLRPFRAHLALDRVSRIYLQGATFLPKAAWFRRAGGRTNVYIDLATGLPLEPLTIEDWEAAAREDPIGLGLPAFPEPPEPDDLALPDPLPAEWRDRLLNLPK